MTMRKNELMSKTIIGNVSYRQNMGTITWKPCKDVGGQHLG